MTLPRSLMMALGLSLTLVACGDKDDGDEGDDTGEVDTDDCEPTEDVTETEIVVTAVSATLTNDDADAFSTLSTTQDDSVGSVDVTAEALTGSVSWDSVTTPTDGSGDVVNCDADIALSGTPWSGDCEGCDFAFEIDATPSDEDCEYPTILTWVDSAVYKNPMMVFFSEFSETDEYGYTTEYTNLLRTGVAIDYSDYGYGYYPGPYFGNVVADELDVGSATWTAGDADGEGTLEWTWTYSSDETERNYFNYCDAPGDPTENDNWDAVAGTSGLACSGEQVDVWEVDLAAGDLFLATVDTVAADTAFDPWFYINAPDTCLDAVVDDAFDCTFEPLDYQCPSMAFEVDEEGTYQIVVASYDSCTGDAAEYELNVATGVENEVVVEEGEDCED